MIASWAIGAACGVLVSGLAFAETRFTLHGSKSFDDAREDLEFAITQHNFRVTGRNEIGEAIVERGDTTLPRADVIHFCNLTLAARLLRAAPEYLLYMPCRIALRETPKGVVVETWLVPADVAEVAAQVDEINTILRDIVRQAAE
ncbi:MAG: DUF302 domain-containing protein [Thiotrichales bacterium]